MKVGRNILAVAIGLVIIILDQATKSAIRENLTLGDSRQIIQGFFNLTYTRNTGAVWGILQQQNEWLIIFSLLVLLLVAIYHRSLIGEHASYHGAMGCMIGGIAGNLIDRIRLGWVTDFLHFYHGSYHWPCFNIADAAICVGAALYFISLLRWPVGENEQIKRH